MLVLFNNTSLLLVLLFFLFLILQYLWGEKPCLIHFRSFLNVWCSALHDIGFKNRKLRTTFWGSIIVVLCLDFLHFLTWILSLNSYLIVLVYQTFYYKLPKSIWKQTGRRITDIKFELESVMYDEVECRLKLSDISVVQGTKGLRNEKSIR